MALLTLLRITWSALVANGINSGKKRLKLFYFYVYLGGSLGECLNLLPFI